MNSITEPVVTTYDTGALATDLVFTAVVSNPP